MGKRKKIHPLQEKLTSLHALYQLFCHQQGLPHIPPKEYMISKNSLEHAQYLWIKHWIIIFEDTTRII